MAVRFTVVKKGYNTVEVDSYVEQLEEEIRKYEKKEGAISNAIINAQVQANEIIKNAEREAEKLIDSVQGEFELLKEMIESEKKALAGFCEEYDNTVKRYFTSPAEEITAPLRERLAVLEQTLNNSVMGGDEEIDNRAVDDDDEEPDSSYF